MGRICGIPAPGADRSERRVARDATICALSLWVSEPSWGLTTVVVLLAVGVEEAERVAATCGGVVGNASWQGM